MTHDRRRPLHTAGRLAQLARIGLRHPRSRSRVLGFDQPHNSDGLISSLQSARGMPLLLSDQLLLLGGNVSPRSEFTAMVVAAVRCSHSRRVRVSSALRRSRIRIPTYRSTIGLPRRFCDMSDSSLRARCRRQRPFFGKQSTMSGSIRTATPQNERRLRRESSSRSAVPGLGCHSPMPAIRTIIAPTPPQHGRQRRRKRLPPSPHRSSLRKPSMWRACSITPNERSEGSPHRRERSEGTTDSV